MVAADEGGEIRVCELNCDADVTVYGSIEVVVALVEVEAGMVTVEAGAVAVTVEAARVTVVGAVGGGEEGAREVDVLGGGLGGVLGGMLGGCWLICLGAMYLSLA